MSYGYMRPNEPRMMVNILLSNWATIRFREMNLIEFDSVPINACRPNNNSAELDQAELFQVVPIQPKADSIPFSVFQSNSFCTHSKSNRLKSPRPGPTQLPVQPTSPLTNSIQFVSAQTQTTQTKFKQIHFNSMWSSSFSPLGLHPCLAQRGRVLKIVLLSVVMAKRASCGGGIHQRAANVHADLDAKRAAALVVSQLAVYMVS